MVTELRPGGPHLFLLGGGIFEGAAAGDRLSDRGGDAAILQLVGSGAEDLDGGPESGKQLRGAPGTEARNQHQGQPVQFFFCCNHLNR